MLFPSHHRDPEQARLILDLRIMIKPRDHATPSPSAVGPPSTIIQGYFKGLINAKDPSCQPRHTMPSPRDGRQRLCWTAISGTPGPSSHPHSWKMDHHPPPLKEVSQGLQWDTLLRQG